MIIGWEETQTIYITPKLQGQDFTKNILSQNMEMSRLIFKSLEATKTRSNLIESEKVQKVRLCGGNQPHLYRKRSNHRVS